MSAAHRKRLRPGELNGLVLSYLFQHKQDGPLTGPPLRRVLTVGLPVPCPIWMYFDEPQHEGRLHFHATYGDDEASFDIDDIELIAGGLPRRAQKMVTEWAKDHQDELRENWNLTRDHKPPRPIDPLR